MRTARPSSDDRSSALASLWWLLPLAMAGWLAQHPYFGVAHDGILYAFQSLQDAHPAFRDDLFLKYGSQDAYTLFNDLYALVIAALGLEMASYVLVIVGMGIWIAGACLLAAQLFPRVWPLVCLVIAAANPHYGFDYGEGFATPRLYVEAMSLVALWLLMRRQIFAAFLVVLLSALLHPIVALGTAGLGLIYLALADRRWLAVPALGTVLLVILAFAGTEPFAGLLLRFDAEWLAAIQHRSPFLFLMGTEKKVIYGAIADAALLCAALMISGDALRRFWLAGLIAFIGVLALKGISADWLHNVLLTQLQPARVLWLTHLMAVMAFAHLWLAADWKEIAGRLRATIALGTALMGMAGAAFSDLILPHAAITCVGLLIVVICRQVDALSARFLTGLVLCVNVVVAFLSLQMVYSLASGHIAFEALAGGVGGQVTPLVMLIPAAALVGGMLGWCYPVLSSRFLVLGLGVVLLIVALTQFDRRSSWSQQMERAEGNLPGFPVEIGPDESVFWQGSWYYSEPWLGLRRKAYISVPQGAGIVFNRGTAIEFTRRIEQMKTLDPLLLRAPGDHRTAERPEINFAALQAICAAPVRPDVIILDAAVRGAPSTIWDSPVPVLRRFLVVTETPPKNLEDLGVFSTTRHYVHRCDQIAS
ncbi:MAG: hypothetical protein AAF367_09730 [Pseudomonadota bacterium]